MIFEEVPTFRTDGVVSCGKLCRLFPFSMTAPPLPVSRRLAEERLESAGVVLNIVNLDYQTLGRSNV